MLNLPANKKKFYLYFFIFLYLSHLILAFGIYCISKSNFMLNFHNGDGIWNLYPDVASYHYQALRVHEYILSGKIGLVEFFTNTIPDIYNNNRNIKWMAILYLITTVKEPIIYSLVNSFFWAICIIYIFKLSNLIFKNNIIGYFSITYFFFPTIILSFTQALRDPLYYAYFVFLCYSITKYTLDNRINLSFEKKIKTTIKISKNFNFNIFFLFNKKNLVKNFESILLLSFSIIFLYSSRDYIVPVLSIYLYLFFIVYFIFFSIKFSYNLNAFEINICLINLVTILIIFTLINIISVTFNHELSYKYTKKFQDINQITHSKMSVLEKNINISHNNETSNETSNEVINNSLKCPENVDYNATLTEVNKIFIADLCEKKSFNIVINNYISKINSSLIYRYNKIITYTGVLINQSVLTIQSLRDGFTTMYGDIPSSSLDTNLKFNELKDLFNYLYRALIIGFLMPIPIRFFQDLNNDSFFYLISSIEMFVMYGIYLGFIIGIYKKFNKMSPFIPIIFLSFFFIILLSYIIPYLGTLYRMRSPFYLIFYIIGISTYVEYFYTNNKNNKNNK